MNDSSREFSTIVMNDVEYDMIPMESKLSPEDFMTRGEMGFRQQPGINPLSSGSPYTGIPYGLGFPFGPQFMGGPAIFPPGTYSSYDEGMFPIGGEALFYEEDYEVEGNEREMDNREPQYNKKDYYDEDYNYKDKDYKDIRRIIMKIQRYNPGIFRTLMRYGMPYYEARRLVRRIVRLTLIYEDD